MATAFSAGESTPIARPLAEYWRETKLGVAELATAAVQNTVQQYIKLFTTLPLAEVAKLQALKGAEINEAKKVLATEATALLHGRDKAELPFVASPLGRARSGGGVLGDVAGGEEHAAAECPALAPEAP